MSESTENPEGIPATTPENENENENNAAQQPVASEALGETSVVPETPDNPVSAEATPATTTPAYPHRDDTTAVVPPIVPVVEAPATAPASVVHSAAAETPTPTTAPQAASAATAPVQPYGQQPTAPYYAPQQPTANYGHGSFGAPNTAAPAYGAVPDPNFNSALYAASGAYSNQPPTAPKKRRGGVALVAALAIGALIGGASGAGVTAWVVSQNGGSSTTSASSPTSITVNNPDNANLITAVAAKASPSVVTISVSSNQAAGTGSGVILSNDG